MQDLTGLVAVVTGAGRGNGAAIAKALAAAGARLALADVEPDSVHTTRAEIEEAGGTAIAAAVDVTDLDAVIAFRDYVADRLGSAGALVNNAGIIRRTPIGEPGFRGDWDAVFAVNVTGARDMVEAFLPQLAETQGAIVNLGSIMSVTAGPGLSAYAASKGAVAQFTKALAHELAPRGIRANAILPGVIETPMTEATRADPEAMGRFMAHTPMGRPGRPEELVGPVLFLVSPMASYVTGALLPVDGGYLAA